MAHFSEYQVRHYKKLFDQYSGAEHGRLNLTDLYRLMVRLFANFMKGIPQKQVSLSLDQK